jgi:hypothetical protein
MAPYRRTMIATLSKPSVARSSLATGLPAATGMGRAADAGGVTGHLLRNPFRRPVAQCEPGQYGSVENADGDPDHRRYSRRDRLYNFRAGCPQAGILVPHRRRRRSVAQSCPRRGARFGRHTDEHGHALRRTAGEHWRGQPPRTAGGRSRVWRSGGPPPGFLSSMPIDQVLVLMVLHAVVAAVCIGLLSTLTRKPALSRSA